MKADVVLTDVTLPDGKWQPDAMNNTRVFFRNDGESSWNELKPGDEAFALEDLETLAFEVPGGYFRGDPRRRFGKDRLKGVWVGQFGSLTGGMSGFLYWDGVNLVDSCETSAWDHPIPGEVYEAAQQAVEEGAGCLWGHPEHKRDVLRAMIDVLLQARLKEGDVVQTHEVWTPPFPPDTDDSESEEVTSDSEPDDREAVPAFGMDF